MARSPIHPEKLYELSLAEHFSMGYVVFKTMGISSWERGRLARNESGTNANLLKKGYGFMNESPAISLAKIRPTY